MVRVTSTAPYPLLIDGEETTLPAEANIGSQACIITNPGYLSETERLAFQRWSDGSDDLCITLDQPREFSAIYRQEFLLTIGSEVRDFRESRWVPRGAPTLLSVPELVDERPGVRFLFEEWTGGETRFSAQNRIVPNRPLTLEVRWSKEYFLELAGPENVRLVGQGWHKEGQNVVLKAPETAFSVGEDERLQFDDWEVISNPAIVIPNRQQAITSIKMDGTHTIQANYNVAFQVTVETPNGTIQKDWFDAGKEVPVDTPPIIEVTPGRERLNFKGWVGAEVEGARGFVVVNGPLQVTADYDRQFFVNVEAKYGVTGDGWHNEGEIATIKVPESPSAVFFLNRSFSGFEGYTTEGPILELPVTGPANVAASYQTQVDVKFLILAILVIAIVGVVYFFTQREYNRRRRRTRW